MILCLQAMPFDRIGESAGSKVVNFNTRVLGREGVMSLNLICNFVELCQIPIHETEIGIE